MGREIREGERGHKRGKKKSSAFRFIRRLFLGSVLFLFVLSVLGYVIFIRPEVNRLRGIAYDKLAGSNLKDLTKRADTVVFDTDGQQLGTINAGHFVYDKIEDISPNLQNAYIAQEDRNFKTHHGVDYKATLRAVFQLVKNRGRITQGGSTITQQVVKNTYLSQEKTFTRKIVEIMLAQELEKMYSKADIMEIYCNTNFYGNNCYGVEAASQYYFEKPAKDLTVEEAAMLAGISNAPSRYEPVRHPDLALKKRNQVLKSMETVGYITEAEYEEAIGKPLQISQNVQKGTDEDYMNSYALYAATIRMMEVNKFPFTYHFETQADKEAYQDQYEEQYNFYNRELRAGGYKIYTSLDPKIQNILQETLDKGLSKFQEVQENGKLSMQGAGVIIDNKTGYVVATVGGRGTEDKYNRAYLSYRQPGSAIKPLLDYAPALDLGEYNAASVIDDHKFEDGPSNSDGHYYGAVTMREAANRSLNTVAWQILDGIGIQNGLDYLEKMHFSGISVKDNDALAVSIGGFTNGLRVVDMAKGYSTLANGGVYSNKTCIIKIESDKDGVVADEKTIQNTQVFREDTAFIMTDILKGTMNTEYGTGRGLQLKNKMPAAGKTGTSNGSKDTWFCGYTKYYSAAIWVGHDMPVEMPGIYGATYAGKIWKNTMDILHEDLEPEDWEVPDTVVKEADEKSGITDYVSKTAKQRGEENRKKKAEKETKAQIEKDIKTYEAMKIQKLEDVFTARTLFGKIRDSLNDITDEKFKKEYQERLFTKQKEFLVIEDKWKDEIDAYIAKKEEESRVQESIAESKAKEAEEKAQKNAKRESFLSALTGLQSLEYRDGDTEALINDAIERLQELNGSEDYYS
ncbi:MAG: transglycosylase domain-containing protein, partial [Oribacterium parvum]|nr:transglycosylase domain-containing protein [Oribacterium parvum]